MSTPTVSKEEWAWRSWHLGEGDYKPYGRRDPLHRDDTGAPAKIPKQWWIRFDEFLAQRGDSKEQPPPPVRWPTGLRVSEHFNVREFDCHDGRKVPEQAIPALARLADVFLEPLRDQFGTVFVTSGYRPADYNAMIGGARLSCHIYEVSPETVAADLIPKEGTPAQWARFLRGIADKARVGGCGRYATFVHIDNGSRRDW